MTKENQPRKRGPKPKPPEEHRERMSFYVTPDERRVLEPMIEAQLQMLRRRAYVLPPPAREQ